MVQVIEMHLEYEFDTDITLVVVVSGEGGENFSPFFRKWPAGRGDGVWEFKSAPDRRFPPYPGGEESLLNYNWKCICLFISLWKQSLLIFICPVGFLLVHPPFCLCHSICDRGGQVQLSLKSGWQWPLCRGIDSKGLTTAGLLLPSVLLLFAAV